LEMRTSLRSVTRRVCGGLQEIVGRETEWGPGTTIFRGVRGYVANSPASHDAGVAARLSVTTDVERKGTGNRLGC